MGEVSHLKVSVPKPRPLGLVKRESVHFEEEEDDSNVLFSGKHGSWTPGSLAFLGRSKTENDIKHEFRSMRDLQETLRQAALLNIVAAVNHDENEVDSSVPTTRTSGSHFVGIKGASILGHTITRPITKPFVSTATGEGISISNFSHNLSSSAACTMPVASHNSTISQLLGQRPRTISIPRPRTQTEQGAFMHKSMLDAKEQLSNMTTFRAKSRKETDFLPYQNTPAADHSLANDQSKISPSQSTPLESKSTEFVRDVSCLRGTAFDKTDTGSYNKSVKDAPQQNVSKDSNNGQNVDGNVGKLSKDQQRVQNVHQMQAMKRHISTSKKKELMKKLTDIAKCEAVDIAEPITSDSTSAPPMIILSQQKETFPFHPEEIDTRVNRTKSMTSLHSRNEESRVPSNGRIQSETLEAMTAYKEAKKRGILNIEEDLRIESINGIDTTAGVDGLYRANRDQRFMDLYPDYGRIPLESRADHLFTESIVGRTVPSSFSPDLLELRPLDGSPGNINIRNSDRRRPNRRSVSQSVRDKLISPSPAVYEASFHRPKASIQMTLVGQSLPALAGPKAASITPTKPANKRHSGDFGNASAREEIQTEESPSKQNGESKAVPLKPWGSIGKQPSVNSPILRTEIVDHLQCVGLVNHRKVISNYKKSFAKVNGVNKNYDFTRYDTEFDNEDFSDDDDGSEAPRVTKNTAKYRKSKLYSAFRASEENLSNLVDNTSCVSEAMTSRNLLNQTNPPTAVVEETSETPRDPVHQSSKEPLYMGCSSRVSEKELRSQYHYVNDLGENESNQGSQFKVMKAIDQDAYFDFQHKKYRKNIETPLNTAPNNPRMHFLKIKFSEEAKT